MSAALQFIRYGSASPDYWIALLPLVALGFFISALFPWSGASRMEAFTLHITFWPVYALCLLLLLSRRPYQLDGLLFGLYFFAFYSFGTHLASGPGKLKRLGAALGIIAGLILFLHLLDVGFKGNSWAAWLCFMALPSALGFAGYYLAGLFIGSGFYSSFNAWLFGGQHIMDATSSPVPNAGCLSMNSTLVRGLFKHLSIGAVLLMSDMFFGDGPALTGLGALIVLLWWTCSLLRQSALRVLKKQPLPTIWPGLILVCIYFFYASSMALISNWKLHASDILGERLATACEAYKAKHGGYPDTLEQLVPDFISALPAPVLSPLPDYFVYDSGKKGSGARIFYVPHLFGYRTYSFNDKKWRSMD
ncbi:MAG: hypothetical protein GX410_06625 [Elusimicrobia bacterium]|nr:hypothetical protein [Elusimicrobiota bacterium]